MVLCSVLLGVRSRRDVNVDASGLKRLIVTFKASIHFTSKTLPGGEFDWGGTSPKQ